MKSLIAVILILSGLGSQAFAGDELKPGQSIMVCTNHSLINSHLANPEGFTTDQTGWINGSAQGHGFTVIPPFAVSAPSTDFRIACVTVTKQ